MRIYKTIDISRCFSPYVLIIIVECIYNCTFHTRSVTIDCLRICLSLDQEENKTQHILILFPFHCQRWNTETRFPCLCVCVLISLIEFRLVFLVVRLIYWWWIYNINLFLFSLRKSIRTYRWNRDRHMVMVDSKGHATITWPTPFVSCFLCSHNNTIDLLKSISACIFLLI